MDFIHKKMSIPFPIYFIMLIASILVIFSLFTGNAGAATGEVADEPLALPYWTLLAGAISPLFAYVLNYNAPWISEKAKALAQVLVAAVAGALFELISTGTVGFDAQTGEFIATTVITALFAHGVLWKPSTVSTAFGGGRNREPHTTVRVG